MDVVNEHRSKNPATRLLWFSLSRRYQPFGRHTRTHVRWHHIKIIVPVRNTISKYNNRDENKIYTHTRTHIYTYMYIAVDPPRARASDKKSVWFSGRARTYIHARYCPCRFVYNDSGRRAVFFIVFNFRSKIIVVIQFFPTTVLSLALCSTLPRSTVVTAFTIDYNTVVNRTSPSGRQPKSSLPSHCGRARCKQQIEPGRDGVRSSRCGLQPEPPSAAHHANPKGKIDRHYCCPLPPPAGVTENPITSSRFNIILSFMLNNTRNKHKASVCYEAICFFK